LLSGFPTTTGPSPYSFAVLDRNPNVAGLDTIYVAEDVSPGTNNLNVQKWTFDGTTWTQVTTFLPSLPGSSIGARGLAAYVLSNGVRIVATSNETTARLVTFVDDGSTQTPAVTALATAPLNTTFRGVVFEP
jgi:hypothetical protein